MSATRIIVVTALALAVGGFLIVAYQVDDWRRDLTTNVARTVEGARDTLLRPLAVTVPRDAAADAVVAAGGGLRGWTLVDRAGVGDTVELRFTRTTRLFRFVDDITVWIEDRGETRVIRARSASRVGGADLGQNPRNLRELLGAVRRAVEVSAP